MHADGSSVLCLHRYIMDDVMRQWEHYDADKDDYVTWDEFKAATFGDHPGEQLPCLLKT